MYRFFRPVIYFNLQKQKKLPFRLLFKHLILFIQFRFDFCCICSCLVHQIQKHALIVSFKIAKSNQPKLLLHQTNVYCYTLQIFFSVLWRMILSCAPPLSLLLPPGSILKHKLLLCVVTSASILYLSYFNLKM